MAKYASLQEELDGACREAVAFGKHITSKACDYYGRMSERDRLVVLLVAIALSALALYGMRQAILTLIVGLILAVVGLVVTCGFVLLYFFPSIIAFRRDLPNKTAILTLNFFLGWSLLGWAGSLVWALHNETPAPPREIVVHHVYEPQRPPPPPSP